MELTPDVVLGVSAGTIVVFALLWQITAYACLWVARRTSSTSLYRVLATCAPARIRRIAASTLAFSALSISTSVADDSYPQQAGVEATTQTPESLRAPAWITPEILTTDVADIAIAESEDASAAVASASAVTTRTPSSHSSAEVYAHSTDTTDLCVTVAPGDTLWSIVAAVFPHVPAEQLPDLVLDVWQYNRATIGENANFILPGQELLIPRS